MPVFNAGAVLGLLFGCGLALLPQWFADPAPIDLGPLKGKAQPCRPPANGPLTGSFRGS